MNLVPVMSEFDLVFTSLLSVLLLFHVNEEYSPSAHLPIKNLRRQASTSNLFEPPSSALGDNLLDANTAPNITGPGRQLTDPNKPRTWLVGLAANESHGQDTLLIQVAKCTAIKTNVLGSWQFLNGTTTDAVTFASIWDDAVMHSHSQYLYLGTGFKAALYSSIAANIAATEPLLNKAIATLTCSELSNAENLENTLHDELRRKLLQLDLQDEQHFILYGLLPIVGTGALTLSLQIFSKTWESNATATALFTTGALYPLSVFAAASFIQLKLKSYFDARNIALFEANDLEGASPAVKAYLLGLQAQSVKAMLAAAGAVVGIHDILQAWEDGGGDLGQEQLGGRRKRQTSPSQCVSLEDIEEAAGYAYQTVDQKLGWTSFDTLNEIVQNQASSSETCA